MLNISKSYRNIKNGQIFRKWDCYFKKVSINKMLCLDTSKPYYVENRIYDVINPNMICLVLIGEKKINKHSIAKRWYTSAQLIQTKISSLFSKTQKLGYSFEDWLKSKNYFQKPIWEQTFIGLAYEVLGHLYPKKQVIYIHSKKSETYKFIRSIAEYKVLQYVDDNEFQWIMHTQRRKNSRLGQLIVWEFLDSVLFFV